MKNLSSLWLFPSPRNRSVFFGHGISVDEINATFVFLLLCVSVPLAKRVVDPPLFGFATSSSYIL